MKSAKINVGDSVLSSQYNNLRDDAAGGSFLFAHQQGIPNLTLKVEAGIFYVGTTRVIFAGGDSPSFSAPSANPRIDLLVIDSAGTLSRVVGTEAGSPSVPAYPSDKIVICEVYNRVSQTAIYDTDQGSHGYIKQDVRPMLGGSYISSDSQVDVGAAIQASKIRKNSNFIPETDNTYTLGSSSLQWSELRAKKVFIDNIQFSGIRFGGSGADGALSISSGTTTIDLGGAAIFVKNYTSISITGSGKLAFSNPHTNGTIIILRSQGDVILTSSQAPMIDCSGLGTNFGAGGPNAGAGGSGPEPNSNFIYTTDMGGGGGNNASSAGQGGKAKPRIITSTIISGFIPIICGTGGGGGGGSSGGGAGAGGDGGRGGGALYIECAGAWNFTTSGGISVAGKDGSPGTSGNGAGGGGGGSGGMFYALYNTLTANSGSVTVSAGSGGQGSTGPSSNGYGAGGGASILNDGGNGGSPSGGRGGNGGGGGAGVSLIAKNDYFV